MRTASTSKPIGSVREKDHLNGRYQLAADQYLSGGGLRRLPRRPAGRRLRGQGNQTAYSTGGIYNHVFSPTFLTEVRVGVAHLRNTALPLDYGTDDATTIGVPGVNIDGQPFTSGQVGITINGGFSNPLIGYSASVPWIRAESNIDAVNTWTKITGNHTLKWGVDLRRVRDDLLQDQTFSPRGAFTFNDLQTSTTGAKTNIANFMGSFLLDQPSQTGRDLNTFVPRYRQWWFFAFAGDKWQATPKLTLDYGLRWEFYPPATPPVAGGFSNYDPIEQHAGSGRYRRQSRKPRNGDPVQLLRSAYGTVLPRT